MSGMAIRATEPRGVWRAYYDCLAYDERNGIETTNDERAQLMDDLKAGRAVYWRLSDEERKYLASMARGLLNAIPQDPIDKERWWQEQRRSYTPLTPLSWATPYPSHNAYPHWLFG